MQVIEAFIYTFLLPQFFERKGKSRRRRRRERERAERGKGGGGEGGGREIGFSGNQGTWTWLQLEQDLKFGSIASEQTPASIGTGAALGLARLANSAQASKDLLRRKEIKDILSRTKQRKLEAILV